MNETEPTDEPAVAEPEEPTPSLDGGGESDLRSREDGDPPAPAELNVHVAAFEGPLDLLLHLIRKNQVNIYDIPIATITEEYQRTLDLMTELDLEVAGEFIYMAALLVHIKSKLLLPRVVTEEGAEEDPRKELVDRLLEYRRVKLLAESLHEREAMERAIWLHPPTPPPQAAEADLPLSECSLFDLVDAFRKVLDRYRLAHPPAYEVRGQRFSVKEKMIQVLDRLQGTTPVHLLDLVSENASRAEVVVLFVATLELVRMGHIQAFQDHAFGDILLQRTESQVDVEAFEETYQ